MLAREKTFNAYALRSSSLFLARGCIVNGIFVHISSYISLKRAETSTIQRSLIFPSVLTRGCKSRFQFSSELTFRFFLLSSFCSSCERTVFARSSNRQIWRILHLSHVDANRHPV